MVGAVDRPSSGQGNPPSASASVLPSSSLLGRDGRLEAGRSANRSAPSIRTNSRDALLGSRQEPIFRSRNYHGFGNAYFQVDDLGVYLSSVAVTVLMGIMSTMGIILFTLVATVAVLSGKCRKQSLPNSCASLSLNAEMNNLQGYLLPRQCGGFVARYVDSGQYFSDFAVAVGAARLYLNTIQADQDGRDLVVFDIDETSLSNVPYYVAHSFGVEAPWDQASWNTWVNSASAPPLDPILSLYTDLQAQNWSVGFITGRPESQRRKTAQNLYNAGYTGWVSLILRKPDEEALPAVHYKAKYRKLLESSGYRIRSSLGDQWSDLKGGCAGERTFKLPNPIYYIY